MNLKLDENLPRRAAVALVGLGYDVSTAVDEGLGGAPDVAVALAAASEERMLVTLDRGLGDLRANPPGAHPGIVVLRLHDQSAPNVAATLESFVGVFDLTSLARCIVIVEEDRVRVRRPASPSAP